ncbi:periplasmic iron (Fe) transport lipoprotein [Bibersteinia trehalosi USDA-ARS-USMARC-188]|uniref:Periplasmic iron (Fe) transport lipoprotein n=3 Tax=Bibersteinia trehalosi TaxID=47735 RepID=A0A4V7I9M0_BIBTR|nr:iron uptake system protein EfeO [Bibersteinia trehalosi]AGH38503.1 periplasmic iron (Fe) transport lipoprotein [Bibersteinia trehalosi USDA-ARS-USMARC-192]AHG81696.1 periplasmic iron (Fe) transport lipoprotein [Bibersteinia trehalosi USDA-ARS-USMARC-188]AHG83978.1 periplasmic iron (Fe) transport lipoprotein [Bibersteinia trehalosi USDA-ARS-USMARC-189]RRN04895.1 EfeM/EfeO family lipoprotein [Bibersteinia trehalosi]TCT17644.1 iron uptake system component EfeO [Bibersteinia trehalosi]
MRLTSLSVLLSSLLFASHVHALDLSKETQDYKAFVIEQIDQLVLDTEKFVNYLKAGDLDNAKKIYPLARMYFERSEPIAESFGDLDPRIDARLADLTEEGKNEDDWSGFHKIERILWEQNTTQGTEAIATQLMNDVKELRAKIPTADVTAELMITGAVDLLNEVSTTKVTGEEEIYSKTDLYDFKANIEGAEKIFTLFQPHLAKKDSKLVTEIMERFAEVNALLAKHNQAKQGYDYVGYDKLSVADIKALAEAVNKLGEPLAQMGVLLEE